MNTLATTRFPTITPETLAALQARLGKPVRAARALHRGGHARRHPALGARHRRPEPLLGGRGRGAAHHPLRAGPDRLRLRRGTPRHPRDVRGHRLPLGAADPARRQDRGRERAPRADREAVEVRQARHPADLPHDLHESARRAGVRGGLLVLPHRARDRARARQVQVRGPAPLLRGRDRGHQAAPTRPRRSARRDAAATGTT